LNLSLTVHHSRNRPELRGARQAIRNVELWRIEDIEELGPELQRLRPKASF
jgi:hypothetical protein